MSLLERVISQALRPIISKLKGEIIESSVSLALKLGSEKGLKCRVFKNLYIPKEDGHTSEIDVLFLCTKGIVVIECKGYRAKILGYDGAEKWSVIYPNGERYEMYNPVWQNRGHIKTLIYAIKNGLSAPLNKKIPITSLIVFYDGCDISGILRKSHDAEIIIISELYNALTKYLNSKEPILNDDDIAVLSELLKKFENADATVKREHEKYASEVKEKGYSSFQKYLEHKCPKCGKRLVVRTAKNGRNAGKQFIGCSGYPDCKYIMYFNR